MANAIVISVNDKRKSATCRETVALCGKYAITVEPPLQGNGKLVLHRKHALYAPDGAQVSIGGISIQIGSDKWDCNEVYAVIDLTTTTVGTVTTTTGTLNLSYELLVRDMIAKYGINTNVPLKFAIYDLTAEGLAGEGEFDLKVIEPYYVSQNQSLVLFKGDKGDKGDNGITPSIDQNSKHWMIGQTDTGIVAQGVNGTTPHINSSDKHWYIGTTDTGIVAEGVDGSVCTIRYSDKHWLINGIDTGIVAQGTAGTTPHIDTASKHWFIGTTDTGILAEGTNGSVCTIRSSDNHWLIDGVDTGVVAKGQTTVLDGSYIYNNATNKWHQMFVYTDPESGDKTVYVSETGVDERPQVQTPRCTATKVGGTVTITCIDGAGTTTTTVSDGAQGTNGTSPHVDTATGHWFVGTTDTGVTARGPKGDVGLEYEIVSSIPSTPVAGKFYFIPV